jgi:hypothetical protein
MPPKPDFAELVRHFQFEGDFQQARPHGSGHINDTYAAQFENSNGTTHRYALQWINHHVFKDPEKLMQNVVAVTDHVRRRIIAGGGDPARETLTLIPTVDGNTFYRTPDGTYWRAYTFIEGARTYEVAANLGHVYSAARAFGKFQQLVSDFSVESLHETIPDFHHTPKRFAAFCEALQQDAQNRAHSVTAEIAFVEQRAGEMSTLVNLLEQGLLPLRVTHNDTKFNNVMIDDETGEGICVIDLDTVMPGLSLYDFGDAVRSGANSAAEDEPDLSKVRMDLAVFDRLVHGYLDATRDFITPLEIDHLAFSAKLMTIECGMRFLTDHLNGDVYFKIHRPGHNLDRSRTQLKMVADMEAKAERMAEIVKKYW